MTKEQQPEQYPEQAFPDDELDIDLQELIAALEAEAREEFSREKPQSGRRLSGKRTDRRSGASTAKPEHRNLSSRERTAGRGRTRRETTENGEEPEKTNSPDGIAASDREGSAEEEEKRKARRERKKDFKRESFRKEIFRKEKNKKPVRRTAARKRRAKRQKITLTVLLVIALAVTAGAAGYLIYDRMGESFAYLPKPYKTTTEFAGNIGAKENLKADTFAARLCVVGRSQEYEGVSLPQGQKGLLLNLATREALYAQNAFGRSYPASITKLVTAIIAFEYGNLNEYVTISPEDVDLEMYSQVCGFMSGDRLTMDQLLHCLLVYSGNDAAMAIAHHVGGTIENFVQMMNDYARSLGCTGTHFANPHGLQDPDHYTTPYDIYLILKEAARFPEFTDISQLSSYTVEYYRSDGTEVKTLLEATDHYLTGEATLPKNVTILGGKTGFTNEAGNCLALLCQNAYGQPFVSIVMGAPEKEDLYDQMNVLLQVIND